MASVNIAFGFHKSYDGRDTYYLDHPSLHGVFYGSEARVKEQMRKSVLEQIESGLERVENYRERYIGCADGTLLHVRFKYGWGYEIAGPGRSHTSGVGCGGDFDASLAAARHHAETYGGISWEC